MYAVVPVVIITGLVFMFPDFAPQRVFGVDGLLPVAVIHYLAGAGVILFMLAHIYLGTTGVRVTSLFKMMITGWHED
ncbi:hypothetical protein J8J27_30650, partial [Mycobacterium tuberculosis]|nr:hypothetical protein [Mycobacterium tuberculosis]